MVHEVTVCLLIGYLLGSLSPSALLAKLKKINLRKQGTGNLGATNTTMVLGKNYGALVMVLDIGKAFLACKVSARLFPALEIATLLAGAAAVVGHMFPFYMKFRGGKGLAAFGGMILAFNPWFFLILLIIGLVLIFVINYGVAMPMSASVLFPVMVAVQTRNTASVLTCTVTGLLLLVKHWSILGRIQRGEETKVREFVKNV